jgi:membrane protease YdiL (CAAX protease family)
VREDDPLREHGPAARAADSAPIAADRRVATSAIGVALALGFPFLPIGSWVNPFASTAHFVSYEAIWWAVVAIMLAFIRVVERRPFASIGIRPMGRVDVLVAVAAGIAILAGLAGIFYLVLPRLGLSEGDPMSQLLTTPLWWRCALVLRASVAEEILYRGYAIERLTDLTRHRGIAAALSCVAFTVVHLQYWGWGHLLIAGFAGVALTALYLWRRNLGVNILAHAVVDGAAILAG